MVEERDAFFLSKTFLATKEGETRVGECESSQSTSWEAFCRREKKKHVRKKKTRLYVVKRGIRGTWYDLFASSGFLCGMDLAGR